MPIARTSRWYYDAIIDWMIANPGRPLYECASHVHKHPNTIYAIVKTDMFKAIYAQRREEFRLMHDIGIIEKTSRVAHASLDAMLSTLEKKKDAVPLGLLKDITDSALDRLGYGTKPTASGNSVTVNVSQQAIMAPVSASDLEEARRVLRQVQAQQPSSGLEASPMGSRPLTSEVPEEFQAQDTPEAPFPQPPSAELVDV